MMWSEWERTTSQSSWTGGEVAGACGSNEGVGWSAASGVDSSERREEREGKSIDCEERMPSSVGAGLELVMVCVMTSMI